LPTPWNTSPASHSFSLGSHIWCFVSQPHFGISVKVKPTLPRVGGWSFPRLPKTQSSSSGGQNTSHWGFFYTIGKVLKCRCPKWPRMSHLDICSPSYGQKKGRESNWQFDSQPLKVGNRPDPDVCSRSATWRWKVLEESYNFGSDLAPIEGRSREIWAAKVLGVEPGTVSGLLLGSPGKKCHLDVASAESCREYYKGEGGGFPWVRAMVSQVSPSCPWLVPTPKGCKMSSNQLVVGFGCRTN
jgi:hypothetical protein